MENITIRKIGEFLNEMIGYVNDGWEKADCFMEQAKHDANKGYMESAIKLYKDSREQMIKTKCYSKVAERLANLMGMKYIEDAQEHEVFVVEDDYNE